MLKVKERSNGIATSLILLQWVKVPRLQLARENLRKLSIVIMLLVWTFTSTILTWGFTGKIDFPMLILLFILPYMTWMAIEVARRKLG